MNAVRGLLLISGVIALVGCATIPSGPRVMVLPGPGKSFQAFQSDDGACREWAKQQVGTSANETINQNIASGAAIGTVVGAGVGAAIGSLSGEAGAGAAIGAGSGLLGGAAMSTGPAYAAGWEVQKRYDNAYQQCMYAKGNQIPGIVRTPARAALPPPPPPPPAYPPEPPLAPPQGVYSLPPPPGVD
jgi:hypothetical protein